MPVLYSTGDRRAVLASRGGRKRNLNLQVTTKGRFVPRINLSNHAAASCIALQPPAAPVETLTRSTPFSQEQPEPESECGNYSVASRPSFLVSRRAFGRLSTAKKLLLSHTRRDIYESHHTPAQRLLPVLLVDVVLLACGEDEATRPKHHPHPQQSGIDGRAVMFPIPSGGRRKASKHVAGSSTVPYPEAQRGKVVRSSRFQQQASTSDPKPFFRILAFVLPLASNGHATIFSPSLESHRETAAGKVLA